MAWWLAQAVEMMGFPRAFPTPDGCAGLSLLLRLARAVSHLARSLQRSRWHWSRTARTLRTRSSNRTIDDLESICEVSGTPLAETPMTQSANVQARALLRPLPRAPPFLPRRLRRGAGAAS